MQNEIAEKSRARSGTPRSKRVCDESAYCAAYRSVRGSSVRLHPALCTQRSALSSAFTLIEIMVVVVIIVLMVGMAVPVFRVINGSRSEAGASNNIAAMLSRARTDAIGIQQPYGVAFAYNANTQVTNMAEVYFAPTQAWTSSAVTSPMPVQSAGYISTTINNITYYFINNNPGLPGSTTNPFIQVAPPVTGSPSSPPAGPAIGASGYALVNGPPLEIYPDTDLIPLPGGIGVQTICNCSMSTSGNSSTRNSNGYLSVGVILFDGKGRIISQLYGISRFGKLGALSGLTNNYPNFSTIGTMNSSGILVSLGVPSQFGLVVYQNDAYQSHRSLTLPEAVYKDPTTSNGVLSDYTNGTPTQQQADLWLDQNATPLLINRYTGTLIKGE